MGRLRNSYSLKTHGHAPVVVVSLPLTHDRITPNHERREMVLGGGVLVSRRREVGL